MGKVRFRKGYYCYTGSAESSLTKRIDAHRRVRKKPSGHIDHLRVVAEFHAAIPIPASDDVACGIASAVKKLSGWEIPGFGSSGCCCSSHLFGMSGDPILDRGFIDLLMYFRMDRLEKYLIPAS